MTRRRLALPLAAAVAGAILAGCGGGGGSSAPVATDRVLLPKSYRFDPKAIVVDAGTSVTWTNDDNFTHSVKVEDGSDHKLSPGRSVTIRFARPGTYSYICTFHPHDMHGTVTVR